MTEQEIREAMRLRFQAMSLREWCKLTDCKSSHVSEFMNGKRGPPSDLLEALNLEVRYVRRRRERPTPTSKGGQRVGSGD